MIFYWGFSCFSPPPYSCFSTFRFPRGYSGATRFSLSLGGLVAATVAVDCSSMLVEDEAYAKAHVKADLVPKDVVLYQYEACPFCNKVKAIIDQMGNKIVSSKASLVVSNDDKVNKWRRWVDDHLVHMLSPNIYRNTSEALESFDYIANNGNFSTYEKYSVKYVGAATMYFISTHAE
ncbi:putative prostaglandin-E synthase [Helianthus debilis subsp. tardiflorus]